jgi:hypothetical protein
VSKPEKEIDLMTKENQDRLDFLRALPYGDYLLTPEWRATRKQALTRAGHRCQICAEEDESVEVYHKTVERLGAEQERDLIALCSTCQGVLERAGKLVEQKAPLPHFSLRERLRIAGPTALVGVGVPTFLHAPLPAELAGFGLAVYLAVKFPSVYTELKSMLPEPVMDLLDRMIRRKEERKASGKWNQWDRLMGRHLRDAPKEAGEEDEEAEEHEDEEAAQPAPETDADNTPTLTIPRAPRFHAMAHLLGSPSRLILCYTSEGPVYGTMRDLLSMAVVGKPGRGKTTALMYYATILLAAGAEIHVWDPHGSISELAGIHPSFHYTDTLDDVPASIARLQGKLEERSRIWRSNKNAVFTPLLLLVDELPVIGDYEKYLKRRGAREEETPTFLIKRFVLEARKWNCYFIGSGQSTDAEILPTRVTENLSSRIVFYSSDRRARMAGLEQEDVKRFLPLLKRADPGVMVFDCSRFDEPVLGAIPEITASDIQAFFAARGMSETRPGNQQIGAQDALTVETLLTLLKQAGIDVNGVQQQSSRDQGNEPMMRMRPQAAPTSGMQEQRAHFPWSQSTQAQPTEMEDLPRQPRHSPSPVPARTLPSEHDHATFFGHTGEEVNAVNGLHRPVNGGERFTGNGEYARPSGEAFTPSVNAAPPVSYTSEEEVQVLLAYAELCKTSEKVTRTGIRDKLGWNNKQYSRVIMPVCDKHQIAL